MRKLTVLVLGGIALWQAATITWTTEHFICGRCRTWAQYDRIGQIDVGLRVNETNRTEAYEARFGPHDHTWSVGGCTFEGYLFSLAPTRYSLLSGRHPLMLVREEVQWEAMTRMTVTQLAEFNRLAESGNPTDRRRSVEVVRAVMGSDEGIHAPRWTPTARDG